MTACFYPVRQTRFRYCVPIPHVREHTVQSENELHPSTSGSSTGSGTHFPSRHIWNYDDHIRTNLYMLKTIWNKMCERSAGAKQKIRPEVPGLESDGFYRSAWNLYYFMLKQASDHHMRFIRKKRCTMKWVVSPNRRWLEWLVLSTTTCYLTGGS